MPKQGFPLFRLDNTEGYTQDELDLLNEDAAERMANLEEGTEEYEQGLKSVADLLLNH